MDPLVVLTEDKWPELRDSFKDYFQVYCPYGDIANGMVAKNSKDNAQDVIIKASSDDTDMLKEALLNTKLIDWSKGLTELAFVSPSINKCLDQIYPKLGLKVVEKRTRNIYVYKSSNKSFENITCPEGSYVAPLTSEHVQQIDQVWAHRYPSSTSFFQLLVDAEQSWGLFTSECSFMAWMLINEGGFHCHLYCEEKYRRRGYSEFIVKYVTNDLLNKGKYVFYYIAENNVRSEALFKKLGYENIVKAHTIYVEKITQL